jgi:hypothetical protein
MNEMMNNMVAGFIKNGTMNLKRCGSCSHLAGQFGVDNPARSCSKGHTINQAEVDFGKWSDTKSDVTEEDIVRAQVACSDFDIPEYL